MEIALTTTIIILICSTVLLGCWLIRCFVVIRRLKAELGYLKEQNKIRDIYAHVAMKHWD